MTDPLKDLSRLKDLFPGMENYVPDETDKEVTGSPVDELSAGEKATMKIYVSRDKKRRGGKQVTIVEGHTGSHEVQQALLAKLKSLCSAGGSLKTGELLIQGDHVKKVMEFLLREGYKLVKQKGG